MSVRGKSADVCVRKLWKISCQCSQNSVNAYHYERLCVHGKRYKHGNKTVNDGLSEWKQLVTEIDIMVEKRIAL